MAKIDLSGTWSLSCGKLGFEPIPARIPGENCSALIDAGLAADPYVGFNENEIQWVREYDWTWSRKFEVGEDFLDQKRIWLNIDSLDTVGEIRINGRTVVSSRNMFCRIRAEVKDFLHAGENTIEAVISAVEKYGASEAAKFPLKIGNGIGLRRMTNLNLVRKIQCQGGWDWGPCIPVSGMYGEICLEGSNGVRIEHVYTRQTHRSGACTLEVTVEIDSAFDGVQNIDFILFGFNTPTLGSALKNN